MIRTVDLVVTGHEREAGAATVEALRQGRRVLLVMRTADARVGRECRRCLCGAAGTNESQLAVVTNAEVVCVDGVDGVEAVVIRDARSGRLRGVNASAFLSCEAVSASEAGQDSD